MTDNLSTQKEKLLAVLNELVAKEAALREECHLGDKFRFVREKIQGLRESVAAALATIEEEVVSSAPVVAEDEVVVYVYLYNAQGILVPTWRKMVAPSVLYEYSVNRPIYANQADIDSVIRSKADKHQHAYLAIAVKKADVITLADTTSQDAQNYPLVRVREGGFSHDHILFFKHNGHQYRVTEENELIKLSV